MNGSSYSLLSSQVVIKELNDLNGTLTKLIQQISKNERCLIKAVLVNQLNEIRLEISSIRTRFGADAGEENEHEEWANVELINRRNQLYAASLKSLKRLECDPENQLVIQYLVDFIEYYVQSVGFNNFR